MKVQGKEWAGLVLAVALAGCKVGPDYRTPATTMPSTWSEFSASTPTTQPLTMPATQPVSGPTTQPVELVEWWTTFNDPLLNSLVAQAIRSNNDLKIAAARVREARAQWRVVLGNELPQVNASAAYSRSRSSQSSGFNAAAGNLGGVSINPEQDLWQAGFDASWELDVFGGVRRQLEAATDQIQANEATLHDVLVSLVSEVAANYIDLRGAQQQIEINQENVKAQLQTLDLTKARFQAGLTGELDVVRAQAQVATTLAVLPSLETAVRADIHRLSVLTGQQPQVLSAELSKTVAIPAIPPLVPVGLPSDLLRRRPDIRRAERQLAAATANIGVATADLFPRFSLTGGFGLQSNKFKTLGNWDSRFWSIGPGVTFPLFDRGQIRANVRVQNARQEQALAAYENTILLALEEVEDSLVSYDKEQVRRQTLADGVKANRRAVELSNELYSKGLTDFLTVLEAERSLYAAEVQLSQSERAVSTNLVALYKALGGGWEVLEPAPAPAQTPAPQGTQPQ
ncbi:MAG TPA: efflux transporter outer membrane subunit [Tepidisphaeraceae bacterium]|nr:efflux transporter outer membrane subunit [Tepidisphaeraceae bacterium]